MQVSCKALAIAERWAASVGRMRPTSILAPSLLLAEATSALYKRILRNEIDLKTAQEALHLLLGFNIQIVEEPDLMNRALEIAHHVKMPATYHARYLALAEWSSCDLWTGDRRLFNRMKETFPWIKWIGSLDQ